MLAISCTTLLCLEISRPWMYLFVHLDRRWGHVSITMRGKECSICLGGCVAKKCVFVGCPYTLHMKT